MYSKKKRLTAFWLCLILGVFGGHRFYVGRYITGFIMLISLGAFGLWTILDLFKIIFGQFKDESGLKLKIWAENDPGIKVLCSVLILIVGMFFTYKFNFLNSNKIKSIKMISNLLKKPVLEHKGTTISEDKSEDIIKYTDSKGNINFVNDINKIPPQYRKNSSSNLELPALNITK